MDPELKAALGNITEHMQRSTDAQEATGRAITDLGKRVERIEKHVGLGPSDPPPPVKLSRIASQSSLDVEALQTKVDALDKKIDAKHEETIGELAKQSSAMGIGIKGLKWLTSAEGRAVALRLATLAAAAYVAFQTYAHGPSVLAPPAPQLPPATDSR